MVKVCELSKDKNQSAEVQMPRDEIYVQNTLIDVVCQQFPLDICVEII